MCLSRKRAAEWPLVPALPPGAFGLLGCLNGLNVFRIYKQRSVLSTPEVLILPLFSVLKMVS